MAVFAAKHFRKYIPIRVSKLQLLSFLGNSIGNQLLLSTQASPDERTGESLYKIFADPLEKPPTKFIQKLFAAGDLPIPPQTSRGKQKLSRPCASNHNLISAVRKKDIDLIARAFKDLLISPNPLNLSSYLIVARAFGKNDDKLLSFIRDLFKMELPRIDIVLNRLIFAFGKCGHVESALMVFDKMKNSECKPDLVTFGTVLAILARCGRVDDMLREFTSMNSFGLVPDIIAYNTVLHGLRKKGRLDLVLAYFKEMTEKGIQPDFLSFKAVIEGLGRSGNVDVALKIFEKMKLSGIQPSVPIYRAMISSLEKMGKMELSSKLRLEMEKLYEDSKGF